MDKLQQMLYEALSSLFNGESQVDAVISKYGEFQRIINVQKIPLDDQRKASKLIEHSKITINTDYEFAVFMAVYAQRGGGLVKRGNKKIIIDYAKSKRYSFDDWYITDPPHLYKTPTSKWFKK